MFSKPKETTPKTDPAVKETPAAAPGTEQAKPAEHAAEKHAAPHPHAEKPAEPTAAKPAEAPKPAAPSPEAVELAALKDRYARMMADFDNYRKRQVREREEWLKRANEELLGNLLPTVDHLELALQKATAQDDAFIAGIKLVYDQLLALLDRCGMTPIDAKGQPFDPTIHEALSQMSSPTVPANVVIDQFRRGWRLAGRLLRPAQVIVSSGAPETTETEAETASVSD